MRIWHDDIRPPPEGWTWARTNDEAKILLDQGGVEEISLDHDLGLHGYTEEEIEANEELIFGRGQAAETGYDLVCWMVAKKRVPPKVTIHSWNHGGALQMARKLADHGYGCIIQAYVVKR